MEALPPELDGLADRVTVILPWGSLLGAVCRPSPEILGNVRGLCRTGATLTVVAGIDPARDGAEALRLGLPPLDAAHFEGPLADGYAAAGFAVSAVRRLSAGQLSRWPSTWARRLARGEGRSVFEVEARGT